MAFNIAKAFEEFCKILKVNVDFIPLKYLSFMLLF